jgi:uncharacterized protein (TIGR02996 family)
MMKQEDAFLRAICDNPDDDTPRLVYADWLDEHGDEARRARAEFIRTQVELARMPLVDDSVEMGGRRRCLRIREAQLLQRHKREWLRPFRGTSGLLRGPNVRAQFRRGLIERLCLPVARFLKEGKALTAHLPIRALELNLARKNELAALAESPALKHVSELHLWPPPPRTTAVRLTPLAESPHLHHLRDLRLSAMTVEPADLPQVLEAPHRERFTSLWLTQVTPAREAAAAVIGSPGAIRLTRLALPSNGLSGPGLFASTAQLSRLSELRLCDNALDAEAAVELAAAELPALRWLDLSFNDIGINGARAITASENWRRLTHLSLACNPVGPELGRTVAESAYLQQLQFLDLTSTRLGDPGVTAVVESPRIVSLLALRLGSNNVGVAGAVSVASSVYLANLHHLSLFGNKIQRNGIDALIGSPHLRRLTFLNLAGNRLGQPTADRLRQRFGDIFHL